MPSNLPFHELTNLIMSRITLQIHWIDIRRAEFMSKNPWHLKIMMSSGFVFYGTGDKVSIIIDMNNSDKKIERITVLAKDFTPAAMEFHKKNMSAKDIEWKAL